MKADKGIIIIAVLLGFAIGFFVGRGTGIGHRYQLKESGVKGTVYKVDTRTGKMWFVTPGDQTPIP